MTVATTASDRSAPPLPHGERQHGEDLVPVDLLPRGSRGGGGGGGGGGGEYVRGGDGQAEGHLRREIRVGDTAHAVRAEESSHLSS
ncbi:hypothetical protein SALBM217S_09990 [Streptomyces griseoloalbus]